MERHKTSRHARPAAPPPAGGQNIAAVFIAGGIGFLLLAGVISYVMMAPAGGGSARMPAVME
ncbi:MAG TPA: hypothetical protein ENN09_02795, partial [Planctomycetes bacterium]|nr:hypothetical protein [Planctomycetota bacterium]